VAVKIQEETEDSILLLYNEFQTLSEVCCGNPKFPIFFGAFRTVEAMPHQIWFAMEVLFILPVPFHIIINVYTPSCSN
jgi:hypothetical protein